ncbi:MAG TPA: metal ABC transporter substrate-binding protein [Anaeromyxobacteraceae bacterium]|nr:metal ABC transporter substrate-binding protein [Anaeromyxobacteraceae bacterium]
MRSLALAIAAAAALAAPGAALDVVTTTEGLAALVREVGGDRVKVQALARGVSDPHFVDANPMLAVKLRGADLLVDVGLDLEVGWLPPLVVQSRNAEIQPGGSRRLTAASAVSVLDQPTGPVDRSRGDVHPGGNPHFLTDPGRAVQVAAAIAGKLSALDAAGKADYEARLAAFRSRVEAQAAGWRERLAPLRGRKILTHHRTLSYFLAWTGLVSAGELEPRPGIPPPPAHLAGLVEVARREGVKAIVVENYYDRRSAEAVARGAGASVVQIPGDVGGEAGAKDYLAWLGLVVDRIEGALR